MFGDFGGERRAVGRATHGARRDDRNRRIVASGDDDVRVDRLERAVASLRIERAGFTEVCAQARAARIVRERNDAVRCDLSDE